MLLHAEIQKVQFLPPRKDGDKGMFQVSLIDKSKPSMFRTTGRFVTFLQEETIAKLGKGDLTDKPVTMIINEVGDSGGVPKLRGILHAGHIAADALEKATQAEQSKEPVKAA